MGYFRNRKSGGTRLRREMEIKEFRVACGEFVGLSDISRKDWEKPGKALVPLGASWAAGMFAARARGDSMEPVIRNRMWCLFHPDVVGTRQHRFVLVEDRSKNDIARYTLKKYFNRKINSPDGTWEHEEIWLLSLNPAYCPIRLEDDGTYHICGWFVGAVPRISRVNQPRYRYVSVE
jgi:phage repressor protein C with HTH and peptisase S24 domain